MVQVSLSPRTPRQAARRRDELDGLLDPLLFSALADATRVRLVACVARCRRACTVGEIAGCCAVDLSVVSRHLKALERAGVLCSQREGRTVRYSLRAEELAASFESLAHALRARTPSDHCDAQGGCGDGCC
jgi:ArsR family transcriptional regulator